MFLFDRPMTAVYHIHRYWPQSTRDDKTSIATFFRQCIDDGDTLRVRAIPRPQFKTYSETWNSMFVDNPCSMWWKDTVGRYYVLMPVLYDGFELVAGGLVAIEIKTPPGSENETLYGCSFDAKGIVVTPPGADSEEKRYTLRDFDNPFTPSGFDEEQRRFWKKGSSNSVYLSLNHGTICLYAPLSAEECDKALYFTLEAREGEGQSPI